MPEKYLTLAELRNLLAEHYGVDVAWDTLRGWMQRRNGPQPYGYPSRYILSEFIAWVHERVLAVVTPEQLARRSEQGRRSAATRRARAGTA